MIRRSHPFTLTEVVIAIALFSILIGVLFSAFRTASLLNICGQRGKEHILAKKHVQERITYTVFRADPESFVLTSDNDENLPVLSFICDNGIDRDPAFCGLLRIRLQVDQHHHLLMTVSPLNTSKYERQEILLSSVKNAMFSLHPSAKNPRWIQITIEDQIEKNLTFVAFLPKFFSEGLLCP